MIVLFRLISRSWFLSLTYKRRFYMGSDSRDDLYEKAVYNLNNLQSNAEVIAKLQSNRHYLYNSNVEESLNLLKLLNISVNQIDQLNCIHVTGTKGKGSTCAFVESILQRCGFKTGFYSSPHLVNVRERIRINGHPISKETFAKYFFNVFDTIQKQKSSGLELPGYFKFLTLMAFKVFHEEKVDVGIIEVGIGGENDCTNIIQKPIVCGLTTLDFDHTRLLGSTLKEIAWQKAGIMKNGSLMLSVKQPDEVLDVLKSRSIEKNCPFLIVPNVEDYMWPKGVLPSFGISGKHQELNVSLALQLARFWLLRTGQNSSCPSLPIHSCSAVNENDFSKETNNNLAFKVPPEFVKALEGCVWPGRSQVLRKTENLIYFLDAAHTPQSIKYSAQWFDKQSELELRPKISVMRVLIFNCTGDRNSEVLLTNLKNLKFDFALFCPVKLKHTVNQSNDNTKILFSENLELEKCKKNEIIWQNLLNTKKTATFSCIEKTLEYVHEIAENNRLSDIHVLVTGSVHLVGGVFYFEKPNVFEN